MRIFAYICLGIVLLVIFALLWYLVVGAILFKILFARRSVTARVLRKDTEKRLNEYKVDLCWWEKVDFKRISTKSFDNLNLVGFEHEANSHNTVIVFHGFAQSHMEMQQYCKLFYEKNFNVIVVDARAHGESEGNCVGWGWLDRKDVISWVQYVNEKRPDDKILLFGLSMGASAVCMASGEKGLKNVVGIISDSAFANAERQISHVINHYKLVPKLVRSIIKRHAFSFTRRLYGFDITLSDAVKQVKNSDIPILFIHGADDQFVPLENLNCLFESARVKDKYVVEGAKHAMSYSVAGVLYEKKISDFLKHYTSI